MIWRNSGPDGFTKKIAADDFGIADGRADDSEIKISGAQHIHEFGRDFFGDAEIDVGVTFSKVAQIRSEKVRRDRGNAADGEAATDIAAKCLDSLACTIHLAQDLLGLWKQSATGFGELDRAAQPVKQAAADIGFESGDLLRQRRLSDPLLLGGFREAPVPGDRAEITKLM